MKKLIYPLLSVLLLVGYSCSSSEFEDEISISHNNKLTLEDLYAYARECGYASLTINVSKPLTESDIIYYKSQLRKHPMTRGYISFHS